jgi:hypothetical protein
LEIAAILLILLPAVVLLGYPIALLCAGAVALPPRREIGAVPETVSILLSSHDDAAWIDEKLETVIAALAAWPGHAEILVGDTSTDGTAAIIERFAHRGVTLVPDATLARLAPTARGEILVMTDARALFEAGTLPALLAPFADPAIGAVAGAVEALRDGRGRVADADTLARRWQTATRTAEDRLFGCTVADRGLYAIRSTLMPRLPADVAEHIFVSTAAVAAGRRVAFARDARIHMDGIRASTALRDLNALWCRRALMNPMRTGWYALALLRALLRPAALLALLPLWVVSGLLAGEPVWTFVFIGLSITAALGALGHWAPDRLRGPLVPAAAGVLRLAAEATGFVLFATGRYPRGAADA